MKNILLVAMLLSGFVTPCSADWPQLLEEKKSIIHDDTFGIIKRQLSSYQKGQAPKIADPIIKHIPIEESQEPLVDVCSTGDERISMLPTPAKPFQTPDHNAGFVASSTMRKTVFVKLQAMIENLDKLAPHFGYAPQQINIKIFEGLRDVKTQKMLFDNKMAEIRTADATLDEEAAFVETTKWVSPVKNNVPVHSTGAAVDIRLWDNKNEQFVDMGLFGAIWGANPTAPTFSADLTDAQKNNRLYAVIAATQAGLVNYTYEFWHVSSGDRYASFWQEQDVEKRKAVYGAVE